MTTQITSSRVKAPDYNTLSNERIQSYQYDGLKSNIGRNIPKGGGKLEQTRMKANLLICRQYINIATLNVRTLRTTSKQEELLYLSTKYNISIIGLVDNKIVHKEETRIEKVLGNILITTSAWRNANNAASGGSEAEDHYTNLTSATMSIPKHNLLIVMGDFNTYFGQSSVNKYSYHSITNSNGQIATNYIQENDLTTTNTNFQKRNGKLWTCMSDFSGTKTQ